MSENDYFAKVNIPLLSIDLPDGEFRLLLLLMIRGFTTGICKEKKYKMANKLNTTKRTIERRLKNLEDAGFIETIKRKNKKNNGDNGSHYALTQKTKALFK